MKGGDNALDEVLFSRLGIRTGIGLQEELFQENGFMDIFVSFTELLKMIFFFCQVRQGLKILRLKMNFM